MTARLSCAAVLMVMAAACGGEPPPSARVTTPPTEPSHAGSRTAGPDASVVPPSPARPPVGLVVLDPGHNGGNARHPETRVLVDAGGFRKPCNTTGAATTDGVPESTVVWELTIALRGELERRGLRVALTRSDNAGWGPCVDQRSRLANESNASLLLSVHADGAAPGNSGFHIIRPGVRAGWTDDIAPSSERAAVALRDALVGHGMRPANYAGHEGIDVRTDLGTLNHADVPAVLLEAGNLRDPTDSRVLTSETGRRAWAAALADGVLAFLSSAEDP